MADKIRKFQISSEMMARIMTRITMVVAMVIAIIVAMIIAIIDIMELLWLISWDCYDWYYGIAMIGIMVDIMIIAIVIAIAERSDNNSYSRAE